MYSLFPLVLHQHQRRHHSLVHFINTLASLYHDHLHQHQLHQHHRQQSSCRSSSSQLLTPMAFRKRNRQKGQWSFIHSNILSFSFVRFLPVRSLTLCSSTRHTTRLFSFAGFDLNNNNNEHTHTHFLITKVDQFDYSTNC